MESKVMVPIIDENTLVYGPFSYNLCTLNYCMSDYFWITAQINFITIVQLCHVIICTYICLYSYVEIKVSKKVVH